MSRKHQNTDSSGPPLQPVDTTFVRMMNKRDKHLRGSLLPRNTNPTEPHVSSRDGLCHKNSLFHWEWLLLCQQCAASLRKLARTYKKMLGKRNLTKQLQAVPMKQPDLNVKCTSLTFCHSWFSTLSKVTRHQKGLNVSTMFCVTSAFQKKPRAGRSQIKDALMYRFARGTTTESVKTKIFGDQEVSKHPNADTKSTTKDRGPCVHKT